MPADCRPRWSIVLNTVRRSIVRYSPQVKCALTAPTFCTEFCPNRVGTKIGIQFYSGQIILCQETKNSGVAMITGVSHIVLTSLTVCRCGSYLLELTVAPKGHKVLPVPLQTAKHTSHINVALRNI
jgi:hypothetical protein